MSKSLLPRVPSAEEILPIMKSSIAKFHAMQDALVANVTVDTACFNNVVRPWAMVSNEVNTDNGMIWNLMYAAPDQETHDAITEASKLLNDAYRAWIARKDLYLLFQAVADRDEPDLDAESKHLVKFQIRQFIIAGHSSLKSTEMEQFFKNKARLETLSRDYNNHLRSDQGGLWISESNLTGVAEAQIQAWKHGKDENVGKIFVPFANGGAKTIRTYAKAEQVREEMVISSAAMAPANVPIFREIVLLRDEQARMLGHRNHAEFRIQDRAIKSIDYVEQFLSQLKESLVPRGKAEIATLQSLRIDDRKTRGIYKQGDEAIFPAWDFFFYEQMALQNANVDESGLAEYFPLQTTIRNMLRLFESFLGLEFVNIPTEQLPDRTIWHPDVEVWETWDKKSGVEAQFIGFLYLDLISRENKYKGNQNVNIYCGYDNEDGSRQIVATVLMCAFPSSSEEALIRLKHSEVVTLFHELGHGIHDLVSKTKYSHFHGTRLPIDIGEMPSTLLENFCWTKDILRDLGCHYTTLNVKYLEQWRNENPGQPDPSKEIPDNMLDSLIKNRNAFVGSYHLRQLTVSLFDLQIHNPPSREALESLDFGKLWYDLREDLECLDFSKERDHGHDHVTFGHLINGYDVGYYGYLACAAFAKDVYLSQFLNNPRDIELWDRFRREILQYGGSHGNQMQMLQDFLKREANFGALVESLSM